MLPIGKSSVASSIPAELHNIPVHVFWKKRGYEAALPFFFARKIDAYCQGGRV